MGKAKRLGTKPAEATAPEIRSKATPVAIAAVVVSKTTVVRVDDGTGIEPGADRCGACDIADPVDLFDVVCSFDCVVATGLAFSAAQTTARDHNQTNADHDAQPVRRKQP